MNDKAAKAKAYLEELRHIKNYLNRQNEEMGEITFLSANQPDAIKNESLYIESGLPAADKRLDKMEIYIRAVDRYLQLKHEILNRLDKLEDAQYADVLYCRYVMFMNTRETAEKMNLAETYTSRIHVKALAAFAEILEAPAARSGGEPPAQASTLTAK